MKQAARRASLFLPCLLLRNPIVEDDVPPKRRTTFTAPHVVIYQKIELFIATAMGN
jgi:hypothetical protein